MKAALYRRPGAHLTIETFPDPTPGRGEAVIRVKYCGICGTDLHATQVAERAGPHGTVLGHEFVGEIVALGPEPPTGWRQGDRLCSLPFIGCGQCLACLQGKPWRCATTKVIGSPEVPGAFAEYARVHLNSSIHLPDPLDWQQAALVEPLAVGLHAVNRIAGGCAGRNVLIIGAGPIGLATALWCRFFGARHVVVSELGPERARMALEFGATATIDATGDVGAQFQAITGAQPGLILECVGVPGMIAQAIDLAPAGGEIIVVGFCMQPDHFIPARAMRKELALHFVTAYEKAEFQLTVEMLAAGRIDVRRMVTDIVGFETLPAVFESLRRPNRQCKVLLAPERV